MSLERRIFTELIEQNVEQLDGYFIDKILFEITSGTSSFGPHEEWNEWWHYLFPRLISLIKEPDSYTVQNLINTSLRLDACYCLDEYRGFRQDLLDSVGKLIMKPECWSIQTANPDLLEIGSWDGGPQCDAAISVSIFFCLILLTKEEIEPWADSILAIKGRYWRVNIFAWLAASQTNDFFNPRRFSKPKLAPYPPTDWSDSHLLANSNLKIDKEKINKLLQVVRKKLDLKTYLEWVDDIYQDEELASWLKISNLVEVVADTVLKA